MISKLGQVLSNPEMTEKIRSIVASSAPQKPEGDRSCPPPPPPPCAPCAREIPGTIRNGRALLIALKPYLDPERCGKIDRILDAMKLAEFAGFFKNLI